MRIKVLGSAAGAVSLNGIAFVRIAARCALNIESPSTHAGSSRRLANPSSWLLLNASPDLRQQILSTPELNPSSATRGTPISTVLLRALTWTP